MDSDFENHGKRKRRKAQGDHQKPTNGMEIIPLEIVFDILSMLTITSLVQFKCVCKRWQVLAQDPQLISHYFSETSRNDPCLILHCDLPIRNQICFIDLASQGKDKVKVRKIQIPFWDVMPEFDLVGSCNGLLCLSDSLYNDTLCIYNPFTAKYLELPKSVNYADQELVFGFGFHPEIKVYKVIKIIYYSNRKRRNPTSNRRTVYPQSEVQILDLVSLTWRSLGQAPYQLANNQSEALINGRLHWVSRPYGLFQSRRIVSFDLKDEQFQEVPKPDSGGLNRCCFHISLLRSCLSAAVYGNYGRLDIWVMKSYNVKESWVKQYSIGPHMPKGLRQIPARYSKIWKSPGNGKAVRVVCLLKNGELLLEYKSRVLATYDPVHGKFKDLALKGIPCWFRTTAHVGCLNWIDTPIDT